MATSNTHLWLTWQIYGHSAVAPGSQQLKSVDLHPVVGGEGLTVQQEDSEGGWSFGGRLFAVDGQGLKQATSFSYSCWPAGPWVCEEDTVRGQWGRLSVGGHLFAGDGQGVNHWNTFVTAVYNDNKLIIDTCWVCVTSPTWSGVTWPIWSYVTSPTWSGVTRPTWSYVTSPTWRGVTCPTWNDVTSPTWSGVTSLAEDFNGKYVLKWCDEPNSAPKCEVHFEEVGLAQHHTLMWNMLWSGVTSPTSWHYTCCLWLWTNLLT